MGVFCNLDQRHGEGEQQAKQDGDDRRDHDCRPEEIHHEVDQRFLDVLDCGDLHDRIPLIETRMQDVNEAAARQNAKDGHHEEFGDGG